MASMRSTHNRLTWCCFLALIIALAIPVHRVFSEVPSRTPEGLFQGATDVIVGEIRAIYHDEVDYPNVRITHYVAEIHVQKVEKGSNFPVGKMAYVRYWRQKWQGEGPPPTGSGGHRGVPSSGSVVRAYVTDAKNWRRRPDKENDEGFDAILPNGLQLAKESEETKSKD